MLHRRRSDDRVSAIAPTQARTKLSRTPTTSWTCRLHRRFAGHTLWRTTFLAPDPISPKTDVFRPPARPASDPQKETELFADSDFSLDCVEWFAPSSVPRGPARPKTANPGPSRRRPVHPVRAVRQIWPQSREPSAPFTPREHRHRSPRAGLGPKSIQRRSSSR
jgi:hypothetical protein